MAGVKGWPICYLRVPSQQLIISNAKSKGASTGTQTVISPIPDCGKKGDEADTSHHRAKCLYNIRLGARVFILNIFSKNQRHASKQLTPRRLTNYLVAILNKPPFYYLNVFYFKIAFTKLTRIYLLRCICKCNSNTNLI